MRIAARADNGMRLIARGIKKNLQLVLLIVVAASIRSTYRDSLNGFTVLIKVEAGKPVVLALACQL
jgi:hypothetical protein